MGQNQHEAGSSPHLKRTHITLPSMRLHSLTRHCALLLHTSSESTQTGSLLPKNMPLGTQHQLEQSQQAPSHPLPFLLAASHLESLGVQVTWITGPWFLSVFINVLPWESGEGQGMGLEAFRVQGFRVYGTQTPFVCEMLWVSIISLFVDYHTSVRLFPFF